MPDRASFSQKDDALRADVHFLGAMVGDMIREQGGQALFERVEAARQAAVARRAGNDGAEAELERILGGGDVGDTAELVRAFSTYFRVVNRAEQVHRIRRRRDYDRTPEVAPPGSVREALEQLRDRGVDAATAVALIERIWVEPVFTAHPTEATRRTILVKEQRIARWLLDLADSSLTPPERATILARIRMEITTTWQTALRPPARPTVEDEREHVLYYLLGPLYEVLPASYEAIESAMRSVYGESSFTMEARLLRFGSWVGGDMDGNPNVTGRTIREALTAQRDAILARYRQEIRVLADLLSQSAARIAVSSAVTSRVMEYSARFPDALSAVPARHQNMPYRVLCRLIDARLSATEHHRVEGYTESPGLLGDLEAIAASLASNHGEHAGLFAVRRAIQRVRTFGFHLATLDVRQDSLVHRQAVAELLDDEAWMARPTAERTARLLEVLAAPPPDQAGLSQVTTATIDVFRAIGECREHHGAAAIGPVIISMAQGPDDVLSVLYLARVARARGGRRQRAARRGAAVRDRDRPGDRARHSHCAAGPAPPTATTCAAASDEQMVMLGYSDSAKDGGMAASRQALNAAQATLAMVARDAGIELTFFHGRGGYGGSRRRQDLSRHPRRSTGYRGRALAAHRAGRGDRRQVRPPGHRVPDTGAEHRGDPRWPPPPHRPTTRDSASGRQYWPTSAPPAGGPIVRWSTSIPDSPTISAMPRRST